MSTTLCGTAAWMPPPDPFTPCCWSAVNTGGEDCDCWTPIIEPAAQAPCVEGPPATRAAPCTDCAYRGLSRERVDGTLDHVGARPFFCHDGMPLVVRFEHPSGVIASPWPRLQDYRPRQRAGIVWRADGQPGLLCAGRAASR